VDPEKSEQGQQEQGAAVKDEPMLPQSKVNEIVARETAKIERRFKEQLAALEPQARRAAELEEAARAAEEAKLSATQRAELERKREREAFEKRIGELDTLSKTEREKRHALLIRAEASGRMNAVASKLFNPALAAAAMREVMDRLRVEVDAEGNERVVAVMGSEQDREPLATAWEKIERDHLAPFFKAAGGAGAAHGGGGSAGGRASWAGLNATDKIAAGLAATHR
jgi:hypothetical protein